MSNVRQTLYQRIGVPRDASSKAIEEACLLLAEKYRPDRNPGDPTAAAAFAGIEAAFETLIDPIRRSEYDLSLLDQQTRGSIPEATGSFGRTNLLILIAGIIPVGALAFYGHGDYSTFQSWELSIMGGVIGVALAGLGVLSVAWLSKPEVKLFAIGFVALWLSGWIFSGSAVALNRLLAFDASVEREFSVILKTEYGPNSIYHSHWETLLAGQGGEILSHRFDWVVGLPLEPGKRVRLTVRRGLFGFEFFTGLQILDL